MQGRERDGRGRGGEPVRHFYDDVYGYANREVGGQVCGTDGHADRHADTALLL